jgi:hypothetical protein
VEAILIAEDDVLPAVDMNEGWVVRNSEGLYLTWGKQWTSKVPHAAKHPLKEQAWASANEVEAATKVEYWKLGDG